MHTQGEGPGTRSRRYTLVEGTRFGRQQRLVEELARDVAARAVRRLLAGRVSALFVEENSSSITLRMVPHGPGRLGGSQPVPSEK